MRRRSSVWANEDERHKRVLLEFSVLLTIRSAAHILRGFAFNPIVRSRDMNRAASTNGFWIVGNTSPIRFVPVCPSSRNAPSQNALSDVRQKIKVFVILIFSTFSLAQLFFRVDEFNAFDPLDHLVTQLILDAQPEWRTIHL